jgi:cation diffusion facilitator CzcD-associated flavoprotein CzcO
LYTFTFDPKTDWSHFYAYGPEILKYFENFADRYNSHRYIKLNTKVLEGRWHNDRGVWIITLEDERTKETWQDWAHIFINGTGILNTWKWPDIDGLHYFQGPLIHSAKWDHSVDFTNKTVGVIGVGSSSVQIVPQLQKIVKKLKVFIRSSTWISPPFAAGVLSKDIRRGEDEKPGQRQYTFTEEDKRQFKDDSAHHLDFRKRMEAEINGLFGLYMQGSDMSNLYRQVILDGELHTQSYYFIPPRLIFCRDEQTHGRRPRGAKSSYHP